GAFVKSFATLDAISAAMPPYRDCGCGIEDRTAQYLMATLGTVETTYQLANVSNNYTTPNPQAVAFVDQRLAAGAGELRDMIIDAWHSSATWTVGFPLINVQDIISGKVKVDRNSFWSD